LYFYQFAGNLFGNFLFSHNLFYRLDNKIVYKVKKLPDLRQLFENTDYILGGSSELFLPHKQRECHQMGYLVRFFSQFAPNLTVQIQDLVAILQIKKRK